MKQTRKRRILIVDDSEMNREILTGILEDEYDICLLYTSPSPRDTR